MDGVERYLELALRLARHEPDLVDSYHGPPEIARRVETEPLREPSELAVEAAVLLAELRGERWLAAQVRALETTARILADERLPYAEEVELTYGIRPGWHDEDDFRRAHELLDDALAGNGDLTARYAAWLDEVALPAETVEPAVRKTIALVRERASETVGLPEGEEVEVEIVSGKRWFGFAHYLGGFRTRILVNVDLPFPASELLWFCAHEAYPGHHTHRAWQEAELVRRGRVEAAMDVLWSPEAVLAEGIAETGPELVLDADAHEVLAERLRSLGFEYDAEVGARVSAARRLLFPVASNVALLLHDRGATREEAREYAARWSLQPPARVEKMLANVEARESPGYVHTYREGRRLCHRFVDSDPERFRRLLTSQLLPEDLE